MLLLHQTSRLLGFKTRLRGDWSSLSARLDHQHHRRNQSNELPAPHEHQPQTCTVLTTQRSELQSCTLLQRGRIDASCCPSHHTALLCLLHVVTVTWSMLICLRSRTTNISCLWFSNRFPSNNNIFPLLGVYQSAIIFMINRQTGCATDLKSVKVSGDVSATGPYSANQRHLK